MSFGFAPPLQRHFSPLGAPMQPMQQPQDPKPLTLAQIKGGIDQAQNAFGKVSDFFSPAAGPISAAPLPTEPGIADMSGAIGDAASNVASGMGGLDAAATAATGAGTAAAGDAAADAAGDAAGAGIDDLISSLLGFI